MTIAIPLPVRLFFCLKENQVPNATLNEDSNLSTFFLDNVVDELIKRPQPAAGASVEGRTAHRSEHADGLVALQLHHQVLVGTAGDAVLAAYWSILSRQEYARFQKHSSRNGTKHSWYTIHTLKYNGY